MNNKRSAVVLAALAVAYSTTAHAAPPKVVKAVPDNGDVGVDPGLQEIRIAFDQPMSHGGMSIVGSGESYPQSRGKPKWTSQSTIVIPVRLQPNHQYWLSINSDRYRNFANSSGEPATPYPIQFRTGSGDKKQSAAKAEPVGKTLQPAQSARAVTLLQTAMTKHYSYRDRLGIDWQKVFQENRKALLAAKTPVEFAQTAAMMLGRAEDIHLWLSVDGTTVPTYVRPVEKNVSFRKLPQFVPNWKPRSGAIVTGQWDDGIGYLLIDTWDRSRAKEIAAVFEALWDFHDAPALVIDVRGNGGGGELLARAVAGCFVDEQAVYAKQVVCEPEHPGEFSIAMERTLTPNKQRPRYRGRIAVLTGPGVVSSNEAFLLMMKQVPNAVLVGLPSRGSSGNPQPHDLENGVIAYVPSWKAMTPDGEVFEGKGIAPDIEVRSGPEDFIDSDPVIEAALEHLRKP